MHSRTLRNLYNFSPLGIHPPPVPTPGAWGQGWCPMSPRPPKSGPSGQQGLVGRQLTTETEGFFKVYKGRDTPPICPHSRFWPTELVPVVGSPSNICPRPISRIKKKQNQNNRKTGFDKFMYPPDRPLQPPLKGCPSGQGLGRLYVTLYCLRKLSRYASFRHTLHR